jgi:putative toxin-antitoxin system antitoxin component (TIGR02293 family)
VDLREDKLLGFFVQWAEEKDKQELPLGSQADTLRHELGVQLRTSGTDVWSNNAYPTPATPVVVLKYLQRVFNLPVAQVAGMLGISEDTLLLQYYTSNNTYLSRKDSDTLRLIFQVFQEALEVYESVDLVEQWLRSPQPVLNGKKPLTLLGSGVDGDKNKLVNMLRQLKYGYTF